ncbi:nicotinate-nucleotide adenylyltransferase [soil metagenome]
MSEIGLFCGTFNPIHLGHMLIAECARDQFNLDKVLFVTSPHPPHRQVGLLAGEDRHKLVEAAVASNPFFEASRLELERTGPSYTIDTVKEIIASGVSSVNLIIGGDNVPFLKDWHNSKELLRICRLLVVPRLRYLSDEHNESVIQTIAQTTPEQIEGADVRIVDFPGIAISASNIRKRIGLGKTVLYMVPPEVNVLIKAHNFYRSKEE